MKRTPILWLSCIAVAALIGCAAIPCSAGQSASLITLYAILNPDVNVSSRLKAVHALGADLKENEVLALCQFLKDRPSTSEKNLPALQLIKNDVLNMLKEQSIPPEELTKTLIEIWEDSGQDWVTRDYALQHLAVWYERGATGSLEQKAKIRAALWQAASQETSMAGTALLGLHRMAATDTAFDHTIIGRRALEIAKDEHMALQAKITAIQVCAEEHVMDALPLIRSLAQDKNPTCLCISAIGALGFLGEAQDIITLEQLATNSDPVLRVAIQAALRRLQREYHLQKVI